jgi:hypothetical protein
MRPAIAGEDVPTSDKAWPAWTDYRLQASGTEFNRHQSDIRMIRITWPQ